jgi:heme/copper-type cytochrome/quinol oxidase subunit 2
MVLNFLAVPGLMIISSALIYNPKIKWDKINFVFYLVRKGIVDVLEGIGGAFNTVGKGFKRTEKKSESTNRNQIIIGLIISIPIIAVVVMLLSSADMIFNYYLNNITRIFDYIDLSNTVPHIIIIGIITFYLLGYVWSFKNEKKAHVIGLSRYTARQSSRNHTPADR